MRPRLIAITCAALWACGSSEPSTAPLPPLPESGAQAEHAAAQTAYRDPLVQLSRVEGSSFIEIGEVRAREDGLLLYCTAVRGLQVVDARDPSAMKTLATPRSKLGHSKFHRCQHLSSVGDRVYVTNRGDRIQPTPFVSAIDLSQKPPAETATFTKKGYTFEGIAALGRHIFVAAHDRGLLVLSHRGNELVEVAQLGGLGTAWGIEVSGERLLVTDAKGGLSVVDIATPTKPRLLGRVAIEGSAQSVVTDRVNAQVVYVAAAAAGVIAIDIANPSAPKIIAELESPGTALQVATSGSYLAVANWTDLRVYDVSKPREPQLIAKELIRTKEAFSRVLGATIRGNHVFVGEWTGMYGYQLHPERRAPELTMLEPMIDIDRVAAGKRGESLVVIENEGRAALELSQISTVGAGFTVEPDHATLAPGQLATLTLSFAPSSSAEHKGTLVLRSNDPDASELEVPLLGNQKGLGVGDQAPAIDLELVTGGSSWKLADQRGKVVLLAYFATF